MAASRTSAARPPAGGKAALSRAVIYRESSHSGKAPPFWLWWADLGLTADRRGRPRIRTHKRNGLGGRLEPKTRKVSALLPSRGRRARLHFQCRRPKQQLATRQEPLPAPRQASRHRSMF